MIFILTILYNIPREIFFVITNRRIILFEKLKINYTKIIILIFIIIKKNICICFISWYIRQMANELLRLCLTWRFTKYLEHNKRTQSWEKIMKDSGEEEKSMTR